MKNFKIFNTEYSQTFNNIIIMIKLVFMQEKIDNFYFKKNMINNNEYSNKLELINYFVLF